MADVCLGWIHGGTIRAEFCESVLNLVGSTELVGRYATFTAGPHVADARNAVCGQFLDDGDEPWLWMIDTDICFEPGILERLLTVASPERRPVVSGLYWTTTAGGAPLVPMLFDHDPGREPQFTPVAGWHTGGIIKVGGCGAGCLLVHRRVLEAIREAEDGGAAWFTEISYGHLNHRRFGEDLSFCLRAATAGFPLYADTKAQVGHVKSMVLFPRLPWQAGDPHRRRHGSTGTDREPGGPGRGAPRRRGRHRLGPGTSGRAVPGPAPR